MVDINEDFKAALSLFEDKDALKESALFITGKAGTGKSTLLKLFKKSTKKNVVVVAPTGIAALNVGGQTIHSFFGFPPKPLQLRDIKERRNKKLYQKMDTLIIDEISMVRADMLDNIDIFLRLNGKRRDLPFGGVQVIFFGDLFQLPPVVSTAEEAALFRTQYESPYFFSAHVFDDFGLQMLELRQVYRQDNRGFIRLLDSVRVNQIDYDELEDLNARYLPDFTSTDYYITLSARNATVNSLNTQRLNALEEEEFTFLASVTGDFPPKLSPADPVLKLKKGSQVMFVKNDQKGRYVNGTIGKVLILENHRILVGIQDKDGNDKSIEVEPFEWEINRYFLNVQGEIETKVLGTFKQFPIKLAWALTIHKSQGKTFDRIIIDLGKGAFESGQTYVALSRCTSLEGIILKQRLRPQDIRTDERIVEFFEQHL